MIDYAERFEREAKQLEGLERKCVVCATLTAIVFTPLFWLLACIFFQLEQ